MRDNRMNLLFLLIAGVALFWWFNRKKNNGSAKGVISSQLPSSGSPGSSANC